MRLVTRGDLDGLTCAVLICLNEKIDRIMLIHPQDITDDRVVIEKDDIIANLPYHPNCAKWFDHHLHTATATARPDHFEGSFGQAPSAARLVYEYYGGKEKMAPFDELVYETDRLDSADLDPIDVLNPDGYIKIGFTIDGRTGLGAFETYFHTLMGLMLRKTPLDEILDHPEVKRRCEELDAQNRAFRDALKQCSRVEDNVVITDFRPLGEVPVGNRFLIYALYETVNVSVRLQWGPQRKFQMMTLGHSIFKRTCNTNVGELAARYGGGGHKGAGSVPLMEDPEMQIQLIIAELKRNG
ncbi:MAG: exopolyphosphatase [Thermoanaerobaculia bacterium]|nr:exopolyphosphatase [Thermoanaerobaculia bacterium]